MTQTCKLFFGNNNPFLPPMPTREQILAHLDSPECPLSKVVVSERNRPAMDGLKTSAFNALMNPDHSCRGMSFGFYCGPGQGKSFTVQCWAKTFGIPFIEVQSDALTSTWQLFQMIAAEFQEHGHPLVPTDGDTTYTLPPCIVFFDEAQALSKDLRTGGLLNATEPNDGWLQTMPPGKNQQPIWVDCLNVCWIIASTDPGEIYAQSEAFHSRFAHHVVWYPAGEEEVALIVRRRYPQLSVQACRTVAKYVKVPRKALAFANLMIMRHNMDGGSWEEAAIKTAEINQIDTFGMEAKQVEVLRILGQRPVAGTRLPALIKVRSAELDKIIMPALFDDAEGRGSLVRPTHKGYAITEAGLRELEKRNINHRGDKVCAEKLER